MSDRFNTLVGLTKQNSTIDGGTDGTSVDLGRHAIVGIVVPASMAGSSITFQVSVDGGTTWVPLMDEFGNNITVTITSSAAFHRIPNGIIPAAVMLKPISSNSETSKVVTLIGQKVSS